MKRHLFLFAVVIFLMFAFPGPVQADGIIVPVPPPCLDCPRPPLPMAQLAIRYHHVKVTIQDQIVATHVDQVFYNPNPWTVEGTYLFPMPDGAAVASFTLWVDGKPVQGQVLDASQARQKYREIVAQLRDPALLEYSERGAVQANIFPIPSKGERRIELEYSQVLRAENGLVRYVYPLNTEKFSAQPLENVTIEVDIRSTNSIRAVYSPSHAVATTRLDDHHVSAGYEANHIRPDADFVLYYSSGETEAFHLLTYRDPSDALDPDGFFLMLLAPRPEASQQVLPKDLLLVLDRSGSMEGEKFRQAQAALQYILRHLGAQDRFNVIAFSTGLEMYANGLRPASEAQQALAWVERLNAQGSTDIHRALLEAAAMCDQERPTYLIFLTDGLPTHGVVDRQKILDDLQANASKNLRLFVFGVGYDVDTHLLDTLAQNHHGQSSYVQPQEALDEILSGFYQRIQSPVLTDLVLDFGDLPVYDLYPAPLPDLFADTQQIVVGRYRRPGTTTIRLTGQTGEDSQFFEFPDQAFPNDTLMPAADNRQASLPRLWATRKIGQLLSQLRLKGVDKETIAQVVRLSIRYGIVTPYTSYLVTEPLPLGAREQERITEQQFGQMQSMPAAPASGREAVEKAAGEGALSAAQAPVAPDESQGKLVRILGSRTFIFQDTHWVDTTFDPVTMEPIRVAFLSDDYYALIDASSELAVAFALGPSVIAVSGGKAYEVVSTGTPVAPVFSPTNAYPALQPTSTVSTPTPTPGALPTADMAKNTPASATLTPTATFHPLQSAPTGNSVPCPAALLPLGVLVVWLFVRRLPGA